MRQRLGHPKRTTVGPPTAELGLAERGSPPVVVPIRHVDRAVGSPLTETFLPPQTNGGAMSRTVREHPMANDPAATVEARKPNPSERKSTR